MQGLDPRIFVHTVDKDGTIIAVNDEWVSFAAENDAPELVREAVVGRPIWDFMSGKETRHISRLLLEKARNSGKRLFIPYRCDSPGMRRFLEMELAPLENGSVEFRSRHLRSEKRDKIELLDRSAERSGEFVVICSWCRRVRCDGAWIEVDEAVSRLHLFSSSALPQLTHGICADCNDLVRAKIK